MAAPCSRALISKVGGGAPRACDGQGAPSTGRQWRLLYLIINISTTQTSASMGASFTPFGRMGELGACVMSLPEIFEKDGGQSPRAHYGNSHRGRFATRTSVCLLPDMLRGFERQGPGGPFPGLHCGGGGSTWPARADLSLRPTPWRGALVQGLGVAPLAAAPKSSVPGCVPGAAAEKLSPEGWLEVGPNGHAGLGSQ